MNLNDNKWVFLLKQIYFLLYIIKANRFKEKTN